MRRDPLPLAAETVPALLDRAAALAPEGIALAAPGREAIDFRALLAQVEAAGRELRAMGIGRGDRVALALRNGPATAAAFVAVAGTAACAPLNPRYRVAELDYFLSDLAPKAVIVEAGVEAAVRTVARDRGIDVIELAVERNHPAGTFALHGPRRPARDARPARAGDTALLLHTSGTTSRPKLVALSHGNLAASALAIGEALALVPADRCLGAMPLFHIHGLVAGLLAPLAAGSGVVCLPDFTAAAFYAGLDAFRPTWYTAVPTMHLAILAHAAESEAIAQRSRLRFVRSSSAPLPASVMARLEALFRAPVIEAYGMTEATHQIAANPLPPRMRKPGSVGLPAGAEIAIVDAAGERVAAGQRGEVVIRGPSVITGYANAGDARSEAFHDGWFRTGDEGVLDDDGYLTLTGRLKEVVNRGGEKVSPQEIDDALAAHPAIAQAIAFGVPHATLGEDLAAAIVPRPGASVSEGTLREWLAERLAEFKVPSRIVVVDAIPTGATGKPVRNGLADAFADKLAAGHTDARDSIESVIAGVVGDVLLHDHVGVDDNFFALGGDSLQAADVAMRLQSLFGVNLGGAALFRDPTARELAEAIRTRSQE